MKEYIMPIDDTAFDWDEMFVGVIRKQEELIRCKDCKWYYGDYCGGFGDGAFTSEDGFCHNAERKEE